LIPKGAACVPDFDLAAQSPLQLLMKPGLFGKTLPTQGLVMREIRDVGLANVLMRKGARTALVAAVRECFGIDLPLAPRRVGKDGVAFVATGPGQWLVTAQGSGHGDMEHRLAGLKGQAAIIDQSDARALVRIAGPKARETLLKCVAIDLDSAAFATGDAAVTVMAHMGAALWQVSDEPCYEIAVFRSFAESFFGVLTSSAGQYGYRIDG
jgi:heterotetrameric sarcosine oxidase gamma subunit